MDQSSTLTMKLFTGFLLIACVALTVAKPGYYVENVNNKDTINEKQFQHLKGNVKMELVSQYISVYIYLQMTCWLIY